MVSADSKTSKTIYSDKEKVLVDKSTEDLSKTTTDVYPLTTQQQASSTLLTPLFNYNNINIYNLEGIYSLIRTINLLNINK